MPLQIRSVLKLRPGIPERQTHDCQRHGTTTLFAALSVLEGTVIGHCEERRRHSEFIAFMERVERAVPKRLREIHLILDNYGTHTHPKVKEWFAAHPRYHLHFTPTSSSWINLVERWFAEITRKCIRRGTFHSVAELIRAIRQYLRTNNEHPRPFAWTASAVDPAQKSSIVKKRRKQVTRCLVFAEPLRPASSADSIRADNRRPCVRRGARSIFNGSAAHLRIPRPEGRSRDASRRLYSCHEKRAVDSIALGGLRFRAERGPR